MKKLSNLRLLDEYLQFLKNVFENENRTVAEVEDALDCFISFYVQEFLNVQNINNYNYLETLKTCVIDKIIKKQKIHKTYLCQRIKQCLSSMHKQNMIVEEVEILEDIDYSPCTLTPTNPTNTTDRRKNKTKKREYFIFRNRLKKLKDVEITTKKQKTFFDVSATSSRKEVTAC